MNLKKSVASLFIGILLSAAIEAHAAPTPKPPAQQALESIRNNRNDPQTLSQLLPIVKCSFTPSKYELILMSQLRNKSTTMPQFREASDKVADLLVNKVIENLPAAAVSIETPLTGMQGLECACDVELVSIMRSGDALLGKFMEHFPHAKISKILVQRDEETAKPIFKYLKLSPTIASGNQIVITEPMIATGGTLEMVISLLKDRGVLEENILVASVCTAPEGLWQLSQKFPGIKVVMTVMDDGLNEKKYIVPGLGDFGDRYFGTH